MLESFCEDTKNIELGLGYFRNLFHSEFAAGLHTSYSYLGMVVENNFKENNVK